MAPWLAFLEAYAVQALLRTPGFHRGVEKVVKTVHRVRHGIPPEELGGTKLDAPGNSGFMGHFLEEVKTQLDIAKGKSGSAGVNIDARAMSDAGTKTAAAHEQKMEVRLEGAERVWAEQSRKTAAKSQQQQETTAVGADQAWAALSNRGAAEAPKQGFMGSYIGALREQVKNGKRG